MDKSRRGFLKNLGASAGAVAVGAASGAPITEKEIVKVTEYEHELVKVQHFLTHGDGTRDGDTAMILLADGHYHSHVRRDGRWSRMFAD